MSLRITCQSIDQQEEESLRKKEAVFQKVWSSIRGDDDEDDVSSPGMYECVHACTYCDPGRSMR